MLNDAYIAELVKKAAEFGGGKIHIIVNNAGFTWDGVIHKVFFFFVSFSFSPGCQQEKDTQAEGGKEKISTMNANTMI